MLKAGQFAPDFELPDVRSQTHSLADFVRDGPLVLAFFNISCPVCQLTLPFLQRLAAGGHRVAGISQDGVSSTIDFLSRFGLTFPTLIDEAVSGYPVSNQFAITHVPSMFLIEKDNSIGWASDGFRKNDLEALGRHFGVSVFRHEDKVPEWKPG